MPNAIEFPHPHYGVPTSIPPLDLPPAPSPLDANLDSPPSPLSIAPLALPAVVSSPITLTSIMTSIPIATPNYSVNLDSTGEMTGTQIYTLTTGVLGQGHAIINEVVSYTGWLSGEIGAMQMTGTLTIESAPEWYAPYLPRPMADIGWTFEGLDDSMYSFTRYSLSSWSWFFGEIAAMPFSLIKMVWELFRFLGPFGLFVIWLIGIMVPTVLGFNILKFLKILMVRLFNFILWVIDWVIKIVMFIAQAIDWLLNWIWKLWEAIPFLN
jgi:hypothetical protein